MNPFRHEKLREGDDSMAMQQIPREGSFETSARTTRHEGNSGLPLSERATSSGGVYETADQKTSSIDTLLTAFPQLQVSALSTRNEGNSELPLSEKAVPSAGAFETTERSTSGVSAVLSTDLRPETAGHKTSSSGAPWMLHEQNASHESFPLMDHHRNTSSVALLPPVVTRETLAQGLPQMVKAHQETDPPSEAGRSGSSDSGLIYDDYIAKAETLDLLADEYPLPRIQGPVWYNRLRYHYLSMYVRLHILVLIANFCAFVPIAIGTGGRTPKYTYTDASTAFAANVFVIFLTRNEHFINTLFHIFRSIPHRSPLWIRKHTAKVYTLGGIHSGCGVACLVWYIMFSYLLFHRETGTGVESPWTMAVRVMSIVVFIFLAVIIAMAHPWMRVHHHDAWELSHRFLGWSILVLVWVQIILLSLVESWKDSRGFGIALITTPSFWLQVGVTCLCVYPWIRLRRVPLDAEQLSDHAIRLRLNNRRVPVGGAIRLAKNPITEKHSFAVIPNADGTKGYSIIVSHAGDWTKSLIRPGEDGRPQKIWVSGVPYIGVYHVCLMFKPFVLVATGSGIAPCLSFLQIHPNWPVRVVWSARFPEVTYGKAIMEMVLNADPNAIIIDTKKTGRPDVPAIIYAVYKQFKAEAVVFVSNKPVTEEVVYALEARKVPTYGAIFDS